MKLPLKIAVVIVIAILLTSSVYVIFFTGEDVDNEPPSIDTITRDTTGKTGESITISVTFSDNINVTNATIFYKPASANNWSSTSILSGSVNIYIPKNSDEDWYYYVTVDDAAGNGLVGDPSTDGSVYYTITVSDNGDNGDNEFVHTVFIEEGTGTWCENCPNVAGILHDLYESDEFNFYYVALIEDKNTKAETRLTEDYSIVGYPTVYIDGGYKVFVGGGNEKSEFANAIRDAESRKVPEIRVTVRAIYDENTNELTTNVLAENNEAETYTGHLRVYLTEIISRWENPYKADDGETKPYHFGFLDYVINQKISISGKGNTTLSDKRKISDFAVSDLVLEELMLIAVIFSSESVEADSYPSGDGGEFNAYYADAANHTVLVPGGNLPPTVGISLPEVDKIHILGRPIYKTKLLKKTILIGKSKIVADAEDDKGIEKVEFYINGELKSTDNEEPYEYSFRKVKSLKRFRHKHTIKVIAYDTEGKSSDTSIEVIGFFL